jgi:hypothetical protein
MADGLTTSTTYFPPMETFQSNTMDIYASQGNPLPASQPRTAGVITGALPRAHAAAAGHL